MARFLRFAIAAVTATAIILLLTFGTWKLHLWIGGYLHVRELILRSFVLLPIVFGLVASLTPSPKVNRSSLVAAATGGVIGFVYGYLAPRVTECVFLWRVFGHWPRLGSGRTSWLAVGSMGWDVEVAALLCGIAAGTCAMLLSITARSRPAILSAVIFVVVVVLVPAPIYDLMTHNQELTVAVLTPYSSTAATKGPDVTSEVYSTPLDVSSVTDQVLALLRAGGSKEQYRVSTLYRFGHGKQVLAVIVLNRPVVSKVELQQPLGGDVTYMQQPNGWKKIPPERPTLVRSLSLKPALGEGGFAGLTIHEIGISTGLEVF